jgi:diguanylate cyclase (GGDEF)-like protein
MTLFKQLSLLVTLLLVTIFIVVLGVNFQSSAKSVQDQLYADAKNTATSLSLSLASANGNLSMMSTMINASFDNGTYQSISLVDMNGDVSYERHSEGKVADVPKWFTKYVPIKAPIASANVSAGWNPIGMLHVQSDTAEAYMHLYNILYSLTISFSLILVLSLVVLYVLLMMLLKPLVNIRAQADAISNNKFILQEKLPSTQDFKEVVSAMNTMVKKVEDIFNNANVALRRQSELLYKDEATGLYNKKYLLNKLPEYLKIDAPSPAGICMMIALNGGTEANQALGRELVDKLYVDITMMLKRQAEGFSSSLVVRMNGTEFFLLLPECSEENGLSIATFMDHGSKVLLPKELDENVTFLSFGVYEYHHTQSVQQLINASDYALTQAKLLEYKGHVYLHKTALNEEIMSKEEWRTSINLALEHNAIHFDTYKVLNIKSKELVHNVLSIALISSQKYSYGRFIAPAIALGLDVNIYKKAVEKLLKEPANELRGTTCSLRLSSRFLDHPSTFNQLKSLFDNYAKTLPFKLIIELPDKILSNNSQQLQAYKELFETYKIQIGIFEFIGESHDYTYLKELRPSYIKAELDYFLSQTSENISSLQVVADSIGINLIATSVMDQEALASLENLKINTIQGRAAEMIG